MFRFLFAVSVAFLAAPALFAAPVPPEGGKGVVFPFPAKAPLVLSINGYDTTRERFTKMLTMAMPKEAPRLTKMIDAQLDKLFDGRKLTAVRKNARLFIVLNDLTSLVADSPAISVLVPVTTHKDFLGSFLTKDEIKSIENGRDGVDVIKTTLFSGEESSGYLVDLKEYTAITADKATADSYAAKYTAANADQMGNDPAETFLKSDIALYVNMDAINDQFGDQIRAFKGIVDFAIGQAQQQGALGTFNKRQIEAMKTIFKGLIQGVEDCKAIVAGAEFRPEGLYGKLQIQFAANTPSTNFLASEKPETLAELAKMPAGLGTYGGAKFGKAIAELLREMGQEFATTEDDARGSDLLEKHLKDLADAGPGADFTAMSQPDATLSVSSYKDPDKAAKALVKAYKAVGDGGRAGGAVVKKAPRVGDDAETHRGYTFASVNITYDFEASVAGLPEQVRETTLETLKRTLPEKASFWIGSNQKLVIRVMAKDWDAAKKLIDQYLDGKNTIGAEPGYKQVRDQLPAEANMLMLAEVESAVNLLVSSLKPVGDAIPGFPKLTPVKKPAGKPNSYLGMAVTLKGDTATVTGFVPAASMGVAGKLLDSLLKRVE